MTGKRQLFDELIDGVVAMQQQRGGKITLRSHEVEDSPFRVRRAAPGALPNVA